MSSNVSHTSPNCVLTYSYQGVNIARVRTDEFSFTYGQNSDESHARQHRAYYPHRRSQGSFTITFTCKGWHEYNNLIAWFRRYAAVVLNLNASAVPPPMTVVIPSRNFLRLGVPTTGLQYGDHTGSMVFKPQISFISVSDPGDPSTAILKTSQVSGQTDERGHPAKASVFYPTQVGKLEKVLYDLDRQTSTARAIGQVIGSTATDVAIGIAGLGLGPLGAAAEAAAQAALDAQSQVGRGIA
jgi:hypothetical protein